MALPDPIEQASLRQVGPSEGVHALLQIVDGNSGRADRKTKKCDFFGVRKGGGSQAKPTIGELWGPVLLVYGVSYFDTLGRQDPTYEVRSELTPSVRGIE